MKKPIIFISLFLFGLALSAIHPKEYFTWFLEVVPAIIGLFILCFTYKKFKFSNLTYWMILAHCYVLFIGGHYTYAEVPFFDWIKEMFHQSRNNYDKVGHFTQGFVPAFIVKEIFIKKAVLRKNGWMTFLVVSVCVCISAFYEFLEWFVDITSGESAEAFLGTQGYIWDTQSDMLYATIGAITMLVFFSKTQDKNM